MDLPHGGVPVCSVFDDMGIDRGRAAALVVVGIILGVPVRLGLDAWVGREMVLLGAINTTGWFLLGLTSGKWGHRVEGLWMGLGAFGVAAFSSWASLATQGISVAADTLIATIEVAFGLLVAVIGHLMTMPRDRGP